MAFRAVLFDWRGTLATTLTDVEWIHEALRRLGRRASGAEIDATASLLRSAENALDAPDTDTDPGLHRQIYERVLGELGLDDELVGALYTVESDPAHNRFAADVPETFARLRAADVRIAVVSDVHVDIRPAFAAAGLGDAVDVFTLSFEQHVQKPQAAMFLRTLAALDVASGEALFVGDRSGPDGAAVEVGMTTLLLPPLAQTSERRLHLVTALCESVPSRISHAR
jgi:FMN phosphatase YigB (HAD superfamily)